MTNEEINEAVATKIMGYPKPSGKIIELYSTSTNIAHASPLARCRAALKVYGVGG